ncbi:MAG: OmpA family protein, partial [Deltaproteobacteria bacterium]
LAWSLGVGAHLRPALNQSGTEIGNDLYLNAAVALLALEDRLAVGLELFGSTVLDRAFQWRYLNAELLAGVHYTIADRLLVGVGAGPGLAQGAGTPDVRVLAQIGWAPIHREPAPVAGPRDSDGDGVLDDQDRCPSVPQGAHPDPARVGCPIGDRDGDTVLDADDQCPDVPQGEHPDAARRGCPEGDRDHDTVLDSADQCPDVAQGEHADPTRAGCPDGDDDRDTVLNSQDQCRAEPQGDHPDAARPGCPVGDRDHDTVIDSADHCPDQPGAPSTDPVRNGCPGLVAVQNCRLNITQPVFFATNRATILPRSNGVLTAVAEALAVSPALRRISVEGHTDDVGNDARNLQLSQRRADSVMAWLVTHGIDGGRLEAHGFGETRPLQPVTALRGRPMRDARSGNRRVEFRIVDGGGNCSNGGSSGGVQ